MRVCVVADLTGRNPNVFYELGLVHALGKPTLLLTQSMEDMPFDIRHQRLIRYDRALANRGVLRRRIGEDLGNIIKEESDISDQALRQIRRDHEGARVVLERLC